MLFGVERVLKHYSISNAFTLTNSAQCLVGCGDGVIIDVAVSEEIQDTDSQTIGFRKAT